MKKSPFKTIENLRKGNTEAILWQTRPNNKAIKDFLRETLNFSNTYEGALIGDPVIEAAHPFISADKTLGELSGNLLNEKLVYALDGEYEPLSDKYRFRRDARPYKHQLEAWESLSREEPRSVLVTSGTGSGKTECFLVPLLNDLANQSDEVGNIEGVQAIVIYPLNALIESQKERLQKWTKPFEGKIRFALYNGMTPDDKKDTIRKIQQKQTPEQVIYRKDLRENPPPILVTNITMLEYMLVRKKDNPIIAKSKDLKWIILDEAHTHIGASAAELTYLIRRVLQSFGKDPSEVRFVATSATIGSGSDEEIKNQLSDFMQSITGQSKDKIDIIIGKQDVPILPPINQKGELKNLPSLENKDELYDAYAPNPIVREILDDLNDKSKGSVSFERFRRAAKRINPNLDENDFAVAISNAEKDNKKLSPLRVHSFHRVMAGLWSCINDQCGQKPKDWRYGKLLHEQKAKCPCCESPVLEIMFCRECGEVALHANKNGAILEQVRNPIFDEYLHTVEAHQDDEDLELEEKEDNKIDREVREFFYPASGCEKGVIHRFNREKKLLDDNENSQIIEAHAARKDNQLVCPSCKVKANKNRQDIMLPFTIGAPFILLNSNPILLEGTEEHTLSEIEKSEDDKKEQVTALTGKGRQLLSFTDNRQGTARLSEKFRKASERDFIRSFIYHSVHENQEKIDLEENEKKISECKQILQIMPDSEMIKNNLAELESKKQPKIFFNDLVRKLSDNAILREYLHKKLWASRDPKIFNEPTITAEFLIKREIYRRARSANTFENLGLGKIIYRNIEKLSSPKGIKALGINIDDNEWRNFLNIIVNYWLRSKLLIDIDTEMLHWVDHNQYPNWILPPDADPKNASKYETIFSPFTKGDGLHLASQVLFAGLNLDPKNTKDCNTATEIFNLAWEDLKDFLRKQDKYKLQFEESDFARLDKAYICKTSKRIIDTVFMGISPYSAKELLKNGNNEKLIEKLKPEAIEMPMLPQAFPLDNELAKIEEWLKNDEKIQILKEKNVWGNLQNKIVKSPIYYRSVEHSAQIGRPTLEKYEEEFKEFQINILNCSTTMEMGVDIGSVSTVAMNNLPPAISNYRQRVGRAGRRGQNLALAFTLCRDRPLDQMAFHAPVDFLKKEMVVPNVALDSEILAQRHINSWALADFIRRKSIKSGHTFSCGDFFGYNSDGQKQGATISNDEVKEKLQTSDAELFIEYIQSQEFRDNNENAIKIIAKGSPLENAEDVIETCLEEFLAIKSEFENRVNSLYSIYKELHKGQRGKGALYYQIKRITGEFLLKFLAEKGFLPAHGFPRDVVTFRISSDDKKLESQIDGYDNLSDPSRQLDIALSEYAPEANVTINGLVYESVGLSLNWKRPNDSEGKKEIQDLRRFWECKDCGDFGTVLCDEEVLACKSCSSSNISSFDSIKPSGFVADLSKKPHDDIDEINSGGRDPMRISLGDRPWQSLISQELGKMRSKSDANVCFANKGKSQNHDGLGFAICLDCGAAKKHKIKDDEPLKNHKPIKWHDKVDTSKPCSGNYEAFKIQPNTILLYEFKTNGFEICFNEINTEDAARAFGSALREAASEYLGIEPSELGIYTADRKGIISLFIYDTASGGAGYSSQITDLFDDLMPKVKRILDCKAECETGCTKCVVNNIVGNREKPVDRKPALEWVKKYIEAIGKVDPVDNIGENTKKIANAIYAIDSEVHKSSNIEVLLNINNNNEIFQWLKSKMVKLLETWARSGANIKIAFDDNFLGTLNDEELLEFIGIIARARAKIGVIKKQTLGNHHHFIASIKAENKQDIIIASRDSSTALGNDNYGIYGAESSAPIIKANIDFDPDFEIISHENFFKKTGALQFDINQEVNGSFIEFGNKLSKLMFEKFKEISALTNSEIERISYRDQYCTSPQSVRMLLELVRGLKKQNSHNGTLGLDLYVKQKFGKEPIYWNHDWNSLDDIEDVSSNLCEQYGISLRVYEEDNAIHRRVLRILFKDGTIAEATFDMGFGYWHIDRSKIKIGYFQFDKSISEQAMQFEKNYMVKNKSYNSSYIVFRKTDKN